eukprot:752393-Hanusia_phi.AAC.6
MESLAGNQFDEAVVFHGQEPERCQDRDVLVKLRSKSGEGGQQEGEDGGEGRWGGESLERIWKGES